MQGMFTMVMEFKKYLKMMTRYYTFHFTDMKAEVFIRVQEEPPVLAEVKAKVTQLISLGHVEVLGIQNI